MVRPLGSFGQAQLATPGPPSVWQRGLSHKRSLGFSSRHKGPETGYYSSAPQITFVFSLTSLPDSPGLYRLLDLSHANITA